jgi:hypothetical protein
MGETYRDFKKSIAQTVQLTNLAFSKIALSVLHTR